MARRFSRFVKSVLREISGGRCQACGSALTPTWEADHIQPFVLGGETDILNGQALCQACNRRKGSHGMKVREPRAWHERALRHWAEQRPQNYLVNACVGAGKTDFACRWMRELLETRRVKRVVVVCPTELLRRQWVSSATPHGIDLVRYRNDDEPEASDFHGAVYTYQQINERWAQRHRAFCRTPTAVVFDELHHAGDQLSYGEGIKLAFEPALHRLGLTGTAWRPDNRMIPFIRYNEQQKLVVDFSYSYEDGLTDGIVRPVFFPSVDGRMEWWSIRRGTTEATFTTPLSEQEARRRLATALRADGDVIRQLITSAHGRLTEIRTDQASAGGLVVCMDIAHAKAVASVVKAVTGTTPVVAVSDQDEPHAEIERFAADRSPWLVAVRMVSEGVDIPRLRVLVYATNTSTELAFRQAVGRVLRVITKDDGEEAHVFIPRDDGLLSFAETMRDEREHQLEVELGGDASKREPSTDPPDLFAPIAARDGRLDVEISDGAVFTPTELERAEQIGRSAEVRANRVMIAKILRAAGIRRDSQLVSTDAPPAAPDNSVTREERKTKKRGQLEKILRNIGFQARRGPEFFGQMLWRVTGKQRQLFTEQELELLLESAARWRRDLESGIERTDGEWYEEVLRGWRSIA
jgi:superfamily II DNA or RNA helicase